MSFDVSKAMKIKLSSVLPPDPVFEPQYRRAPNRGYDLTPAETIIAVKNAFRYVPESLHETLAPEFLQELTHLNKQDGWNRESLLHVEKDLGHLRNHISHQKEDHPKTDNQHEQREG